MGPEGGNKGGTVVVEGTPEDVAAHPASHTGRFLRPLLDGREATQPKPARRRASAAASKTTKATRTATKSASKSASKSAGKPSKAAPKAS
jgi:excinuclease ABC subunit A